MKNINILGGGAGHQRRVLVLVLPDLVVDAEASADPGAITPPEHKPPDDHTPTCSELEEGESPRELARAAWRRPRSLSVDVTLEEVGHELRRIGDNFKEIYSSSLVSNFLFYIHNNIKEYINIFSFSFLFKVFILL